MKKFFLMMCVAVFPIAAFTACNDDDDKKPESVTVAAKDGKTTLIADGEDAIEFVVTADEVTVNGTISYKKSDSDTWTTINGSTLTIAAPEEGKSAAGTYNVKATYLGVESESINITVTDPVIIPDTDLALLAAGTYNVTVEIDGADQSVGDDPITTSITIARDKDNVITFELAELSVDGQTMASDVKVENVALTGTESKIAIDHKGPATAVVLGNSMPLEEISIAGNIEGGDLNLKITLSIAANEIAVDVKGSKVDEE